MNADNCSTCSDYTGHQQLPLNACQTIDKGQFCLAIKSANKNLSSVHAKIGRFCRPVKLSDFADQHRTRTIPDNKIGKLFGYWSTYSVYVSKVIV